MRTLEPRWLKQPITNLTRPQLDALVKRCAGLIMRDGLYADYTLIALYNSARREVCKRDKTAKRVHPKGGHLGQRERALIQMYGKEVFDNAQKVVTERSKGEKRNKILNKIAEYLLTTEKNGCNL